MKNVEPLLTSIKGIIDYSIDLNHSDKLVTISSESADIDKLIAKFKKAGHTAEKV